MIASLFFAIFAKIFNVIIKPFLGGDNNNGLFYPYQYL